MKALTQNCFVFRVPSFEAGRVQHGFTLIELLVVIALIIILGSLVNTALQSSRSWTQHLRCAKNLKDIHVMTSVFFEENRYRMPLDAGQQGDLGSPGLWTPIDAPGNLGPGKLSPVSPPPDMLLPLPGPNPNNLPPPGAAPLVEVVLANEDVQKLTLEEFFRCITEDASLTHCPSSRIPSNGVYLPEQTTLQWMQSKKIFWMDDAQMAQSILYRDLNPFHKGKCNAILASGRLVQITVGSANDAPAGNEIM